MLLDGVAGIKFFFSLKFKQVVAIIRAHISFYSQVSRVLKQRKTLAQKPNYFKTRSIVWDYFIKKKKKYNEL